jgi:hypothetical protein
MFVSLLRYRGILICDNNIKSRDKSKHNKDFQELHSLSGNYYYSDLVKENKMGGNIERIGNIRSVVDTSNIKVIVYHGIAQEALGHFGCSERRSFNRKRQRSLYNCVALTQGPYISIAPTRLSHVVTCFIEKYPPDPGI